MSDSRFSDIIYDYEPGAIPPGLWQQTVWTAIHGKRGQALLKELHEALLMLPQKRLILGSLYNDGECCALGALAIDRLRRGERLREISSLEEFDEDAWRWDEDEYELLEFAVKYLGMTMALAWKIAVLNDEEWQDDTPERRYERMLGWIERNLA